MRVIGRFGTTERGHVLEKFGEHCLKERNETNVVSVDSLQSTAKKEQKGKVLGKIIIKKKQIVISNGSKDHFYFNFC